MKINIALLGILLLSASCNQQVTENAIVVPEKIPVNIVPVQQDTISTDINLSGYFTTEDETPLSFKNGGIIDHIYVKEGDAIRKGQLLATVTGEEVNTGLSQAEIGFEKAQRDYQRTNGLYRDSVATLEQMQNAKTAMDMARQKMELARTNTRHSGIYALENGYVLERYLNEGQLAGPGTPVLLVNGAGKDQWLFQVSVSESQWVAIQKGDRAEITTDVMPNTAIRATVVKKSKSVDPATGGLTVKLSVKNTKNLPLASGIFGRATLYPSQKQIVWSIPYGSLLDGESKSGYVFITNDKKHARKIRVHISGLSSDQVLIDQGLDSARYLIVSGSAYLKDGSAITPNYQKD